MSGKDTSTLLEVKDLSLHFGGVTALTGVELSVKHREIVAIIGPNGAGKTCLLNCISGFYKPQSGKIRYNGIDICKVASDKVAKLGISRTFQNIELYTGMTTLDNLMAARHIYFKTGVAAGVAYFGRAHKEEIKHRKVVEDIINFLELEGVRKRVVGSLPYGLRKRVELGRALALEPKLLLLDEPAAGMNVEEKEDMARFIIDIFEGQGKTYPDTAILRDGIDSIIIIEHDMGLVMDLCDRVCVLDFGQKIAEGFPDEIKANPVVVKAYLGSEIE